jgi:S-adenosylmethionine decarboxylase
MSNKLNQNKLTDEQPIIDVKTSQSFLHNESVVAINQDRLTAKPEVEFAGKHYIVDFWGKNFLQDIDVIESALKDAANVAGAILLHIYLHKFSSGGGVTGVALLAESHISVHTWPESDYAAFDVFMCGNAKPEKAVALLKEVFQPERVEVKEILRGENL